MEEEQTTTYFPAIRAYSQSQYNIGEEWKGLKSCHWGKGGLRVFEKTGTLIFEQGKNKIKIFM